MSDLNSKFQFYEIVKVISGKDDLKEIKGEKGVILGKGEEGDVIGYGVFIYRDEEVWDVKEEDIESTGEFSSREEMYSGESIRVRVDEKGRGRISD